LPYTTNKQETTLNMASHCWHFQTKPMNFKGSGFERTSRCEYMGLIINQNITR